MTAPSTLHREAADLWLSWSVHGVDISDALEQAKGIVFEAEETGDDLARATVAPILQAWWDACPTPDRLICWACRMGGRPGSRGRRRAVLLGCLCARYVPDRDVDEAHLQSVGAAEAWAWGDDPGQLKAWPAGSVAGICLAAVANEEDPSDAVRYGAGLVDRSTWHDLEGAYNLADLIRAACPGVPL